MNDATPGMIVIMLAGFIVFALLVVLIIGMSITWLFNGMDKFGKRKKSDGTPLV